MSSRKLGFLLAAISVSIISCSKGGDNKNTIAGISVPGGSAFAGNVTIYPNCGANTATIQVGTQYGGQMIQTITVNNGATFNIQVQPGTYRIYAQAGQCTIAGDVIGSPNQVLSTPVCLGANCPTATTYGQTSDPYGTNCQWSMYGCNGNYYPGNGSTVFGKPNIYFTSKSDKVVNLEIVTTPGNNLLASAPSHTPKGWTFKVLQNGQIESGSAKMDYAYYDVQADENLLQYDDSICSGRDAIVGKMAEYLSARGFSTRVVEEFKTHWKNHMPPNEKLCAYPQESAQIEKIAKYKSSVAFPARRVWFMVIPEVDQASMKLMPPNSVVAKVINKKGNDAFKTAAKIKDARSIASDTDLYAEEWGVGFLLVR